MDRLLLRTTADTTHWLPLLESTADALVDLLLTPDESQQRALLADVVTRDPVFALWAMALSNSATVHELAAELLTDLVAKLGANASGESNHSKESDKNGREEVVANVVNKARLRGEVAEHLCDAEESVDLRDARHYASLLDWRNLLEASSPDEGNFADVPAGAVFSDEIAAALDEFDSPETAAASPLVQLLQSATEIAKAVEADDEVSSIAEDMPIEKIRRQVRREQRRWLQPSPGAHDRLSTLLALLQQESDARRQFDEKLEAEKLEAMAELAAGAGHEINPPLAIISGRAQLFLRDEANPQRRRELATINRQAIRVHEMISDMMLFARPEPPSFEPVAVSALLEKVCHELASEAADRRVELRLSPVAEDLLVSADPVQLAVAIRAALVNALEALSDGGKVDVSADADESASERAVEIIVRDNGPGIAEDVRRHLFDPFYSGRAAGRGLGLGMSKCWRIVTNHGGEVILDAPLGVGTTVRITLPAAGSIPATHNGHPA